MKDPVCKKCNGTGWIFTSSDGADIARPCDCKKEESHFIRGKKANIPERFLAADLEYAFIAETESQKKVKSAVKRFIRDYPAIEKGLLLQGNVGLGKTTLLSAIGYELIKKNFNIYYIDWNDLTRVMGSGEDAGSRDFGRINQLIHKLATTEVLLFDEFGASKVSPWVSDHIYYLINKRYNNKRTTLFATNYFDNVSDNRETLEDRVGDRIRSRLFEMTTPLLMKGFDYRHRV